MYFCVIAMGVPACSYSFNPLMIQRKDVHIRWGSPLKTPFGIHEIISIFISEESVSVLVY